MTLDALRDSQPALAVALAIVLLILLTWVSARAYRRARDNFLKLRDFSFKNFWLELVILSIYAWVIFNALRWLANFFSIDVPDFRLLGALVVASVSGLSIALTPRYREWKHINQISKEI